MTEPAELAVSLRATGRSRRRLRVNRVAESARSPPRRSRSPRSASSSGRCSAVASSALNWDFFTKGPAVFGQSGGGIAPAIVGTLILVATATVFALPTGVLTAIYVASSRRPGSASRCGSGSAS